MNKPTAAIFPLVKELDPVAAMADNERDEAELVKSRRLIALLALLLVVTGVWAWFATLDEVSTGTGKVIPSSREQVLQTLDGGILTELNVREGSRVAAGQVVARLDPTRISRKHSPDRRGEQPTADFSTIAEGLAGATGGRNSPLSQSQGAANEVYAATGAVVIAGQ